MDCGVWLNKVSFVRSAVMMRIEKTLYPTVCRLQFPMRNAIQFGEESKARLEKIFSEENENFLLVAINVKDETDVKKAIESGYIFNVSSLGTYNVGPLSGIYCATKHAVKAISETLAQEVKGFGIHVTDVKPGFMRTEFFGFSYKTTAPEGSPYKHPYDENMEFYMGQNGNQIGNPNEVAKLYIQVAEMENSYTSLPMGTDSCDGIREIVADTVKLMNEMRPIAETMNS